ncbi:hypothetical protein [Corynebacterium tapiri]|uniref:Recombinase A n=1 Tax=Corynebacterium tapiri TaxID=1448266 RepID=A0A5C4U4C2_9CORY|nr:hypothetical protein [Corynebacterium tapiri]TNL98492.1 hypothetical protein FHE74_04640 [Corynebacterium tapiri]
MGTQIRDTGDRDHRIAQLRARMAAVAGVPSREDGLNVGLSLPVPRRAVTTMGDCPALVVECISQVTQSGGYVGVVGWPDLCVAAIERMEQLVLVPDPGSDPLGVTSVLVEGLDLVVCHSRVPLTLSPVRARPLLGRLRKGKAALVLVGLDVASPALRIDAHISEIRGIERGRGRIDALDIDVRMRTRDGRPARETLTIGRAREHLRAV